MYCIKKSEFLFIKLIIYAEYTNVGCIRAEEHLTHHCTTNENSIRTSALNKSVFTNSTRGFTYCKVKFDYQGVHVDVGTNYKETI